MENFVITIARQYGSGGRTVGKMLAEKLGVSFYDKQIIQMASSAAFMPQPGFAVYAASKSYVLSFSRALGCELKERDISVTAVCPGPVKTEFFDIAETYEAVRLYKKLTMAKADKVVYQALVDAKHGRSVSVYGPLMKGFRVLAKFLPADFMMMFVH